MSGEMTDERAERAILSHAEAYRLVEEARQMRAERDDALARLDAVEAEAVEYRSAVIVHRMTDLDDLILPFCLICNQGGHAVDEIQHGRSCPLSREPGERGREIVEAANAMQDALLACRFPAGDDSATVDAQAKAAMDRWEALLPDAREGE